MNEFENRSPIRTPKTPKVNNFFRTEDDQYLNFEEFREKLVQKYQNSGVVDAIKTQLRVKILNDLQDKKSDSKNSKPSLFRKTIDSIVAKYLKSEGYEYTLSVFGSESAISDTINVADKELFTALGFERTDFISKDKTALLCLFEYIKDLLSKKKNSVVIQTESMPGEKSLVEEQLRRLDENYFLQIQNERDESMRSLEEKMIEFQKDCEQRMQSEMSTRVKVFEETLLTTMRFEESAKYRDKIAKIKEEYERSYNRKLEQFHMREREILEKLERKEREVEKRDYEQRQAMMFELQQFEQKVNLLKKEQADIQSKKQILEEKMKKLDSMTANYSSSIASEIATHKQKLDIHYSNLTHNFLEEKKKVEKERDELRLIKDKVEKAEVNFETLQQTREALTKLRSEVEESRARAQHLEIQNDGLHQEIGRQQVASQQSMESLLNEMENMKRQYEKEIAMVSAELIETKTSSARANDELKMLVEKEKKKFNNQLKLLRDEVEREVRLEFENKLSQEKGNYNVVASLWNSERSKLLQELDRERKDKRNIQEHCERYVLKIKELEVEVANAKELHAQAIATLHTPFKPKPFSPKRSDNLSPKIDAMSPFSTRSDSPVQHAANALKNLREEAISSEKKLRQVMDTPVEIKPERSSTKLDNSIEKHPIEALRLEKENMQKQIASLEAEKLRMQKLEEEKILMEKRNQERIEKEKKEKALLEQEKIRLERELKETEERNKREAEQRERLIRAELRQKELEEQKRIEIERREIEEKAQIEREEREREEEMKRVKEEQEAKRREKERRDLEELERKYKEEKERRESLERKQREENLRIEREKLERERIERERIQKEILEKQLRDREEAERREREAERKRLDEKEKQEREIIERQRERENQERKQKEKIVAGRVTPDEEVPTNRSKDSFIRTSISVFESIEEDLEDNTEEKIVPTQNPSPKKKSPPKSANPIQLIKEQLAKEREAQKADVRESDIENLDKDEFIMDSDEFLQHESEFNYDSESLFNNDADIPEEIEEDEFNDY